MKNQIPDNIAAAICTMLYSCGRNISPTQLKKLLESSQSSPPLQQSLKIKDFCRLCGITAQTLHNWEKSGKIRLSRVGHTVRVPHTEAERILNGMR